MCDPCSLDKHGCLWPCWTRPCQETFLASLLDFSLPHARLEHAARLEPFHLKRERAQGHFDPETGAYVPHAAERPIVADAWADELPGAPVRSSSCLGHDSGP